MDMRSYPMFHELVRIIDRYRDVPNVEIEVRLGWKEGRDRFDTNVGETFFKRIRDTLRNTNALREVSQESNVYTSGILRKVVTHGERDDIHKKKRLEVVDFNILGTPYDARVSVCQEIPVRTTKTRKWSFLRHRQRSSYLYKMWRYDLTKCTSATPADEFTEDLVMYEIELELDVNKVDDCSSSYLAHAAVVKIIDLVEMNGNEKINLKSIDISSRNKNTTTKTNEQSKWLPTIM